VLSKAEMLRAIEAYLVAQMSEEPVDASVLMIYSLNGRSAIEASISTLTTILTNILKEPDNLKYRRIRMANKIITEKLSKVKGAVNFLKAVGFTEEMVPNESNGEIEPFLTMAEPLCPIIQQAVEELSGGSPVLLKLHRDAKVFFVDPSLRHLPQPYIPQDFFELSAAEVKREQMLKTGEVEKLTTLRTREMREAGSGGGKRQQYKYTLIRVRFPNSYILQGVFNARENLMAVREFIAQNLHSSACASVFNLTSPAGGRLDEDERSLLECGLTPTALLYFELDQGTPQPASFLEPELEKRAERLPNS